MLPQLYNKLLNDKFSLLSTLLLVPRARVYTIKSSGRLKRCFFGQIFAKLKFNDLWRVCDDKREYIVHFSCVSVLPGTRCKFSTECLAAAGAFCGFSEVEFLTFLIEVGMHIDPKRREIVHQVDSREESSED